MSDKDRNSTRPGPPPKPTKGGISTGLKVGGLTKAQSSDDALRAENEALKRQPGVGVEASLLARIQELRAENERLTAEVLRALDEPTQNEHDLWAENGRLRAALEQIANYPPTLPYRTDRHVEIARAALSDIWGHSSG